MTINDATNALTLINSDSISTDSCATNLANISTGSTIELTPDTLSINTIELTPDTLSINTSQGLTWVASSWETMTGTNSSQNNYWYRDKDYLLPSYTLPYSITTESTIASIEECFSIECFKDRLNDLNKLFKKYNINIIFKYESNKSENNKSKNHLNPNEYSTLMEYIVELIKCIVQNNSASKDELEQIYETIKVANYFAKKFFE